MWFFVDRCEASVMILITSVDPIWRGRLRRLAAQVFLLTYTWAAAY